MIHKEKNAIIGILQYRKKEPGMEPVDVQD